MIIYGVYISAFSKHFKLQHKMNPPPFTMAVYLNQTEGVHFIQLNYLFAKSYWVEYGRTGATYLNVEWANNIIRAKEKHGKEVTLT